MRLVLVLVGLAGMALGAVALLNANSAGFPDGYISPFDRSTAALVIGLAYGLLLAGIFTLAAAVMRKQGRAWVGVVVVLLAWGGLAILDNCWGLGWCPSIYQQLTGITFDDGQGG